MGGNLYSSPWRKFHCTSKPWSKEHVQELKNGIPAITFPEAKGVTEGNIVLIGPVKSGKSSFINSVLSIYKGRLVQKAAEGEADESITKKLQQFKCRNILVSDTMGLELGGGGFHIDDILYLLKGNIPKDYKFNPAHPITEDSPSFNRNPSNADKVHCVVYCVDSNLFVGDVPRLLVEKIQNLQAKIVSLGVPRIMILTKIDLLCADVKKDIANTFKSFRIETAVKKASEVFKLPSKYIHPVKPFTDEMEPMPKQSILLLEALKYAVQYAEDFIEEQENEQKQQG